MRYGSHFNHTQIKSGYHKIMIHKVKRFRGDTDKATIVWLLFIRYIRNVGLLNLLRYEQMFQI